MKAPDDLFHSGRPGADDPGATVGAGACDVSGASGGSGGSGGGRHFAARLSDLLRATALDVAYHRGEGDRLYYRDTAGRQVEVLDFVGGYGALLLGHNHPALVAEAQRLLTSGRPIHAQGSEREPAQRVARELSRRAGGDYRVVLANSGAEAVEAAMKHAILETGSRTFIALEGAFHGKTLGAIQLTANPAHREPFTLAGLTVLRVRPNDVADLEQAFARAGRPAGFVFEPIQGEGGVRPLDRDFLHRAAALCDRHDAPMIADECQTGVGRTGRFLACHGLGVQPDYVLLSKALGGGLAKTAALLVRRPRYVDEFDLKHTSTFAADDFSCAIALKTLELLDDHALAECAAKGERIRARLRSLADRFPDAIADVRGRGLMIGLQLRPQHRSDSFILRYLSSQDDLALAVVSYLLNAHRVRVAPTLSDRDTLRLQPSLLVGEDAIDRLLAALQDACERLGAGDGPGLTAHLAEPPRSGVEQPAPLRSDWKPCRYQANQASESAMSRTPVAAQLQAAAQLPGVQPPGAKLPGVAWLCHLIDADDLVSLDGRFDALDFDQRDRWLDRLAPMAGPVLMNEVEIRSRRGDAVRLFPIMLPVTSRWMKRWISARRFRELSELVHAGVRMAASLGCSLVSLGQYTSIATLNGTTLHTAGVGVTTGNSYSIALAIAAIRDAQRGRGVRPADATLAVIGAAGNIGRTCAQCLAHDYRRVLLVGSSRPDSVTRLRRLADTIPNAHVTIDPGAIASADVVVAATNAVDGPLQPHHFAPDAVVCDLSVPATVGPRVADARPDLLIIKGGVVQLPHAEDLGIVGFPLPTGQTYGCMAEGLLLGFDGVHDTAFTGSLTPAHVERVQRLADRHGFSLADYKTSCVLGTERREPAHVHA